MLSPLPDGRPRTPTIFRYLQFTIELDLSQAVIGPTITLFEPPANLAAAIRA